MQNALQKHYLWRDREIKLIDGSTLSMQEDTKKNQATYPQPESQKAGLGFPIARIVAVISYTTGAVLDLSMGQYSGKETGEHALLRELISMFNKGDVVLADSYYASFFLCATLISMGVDFAFPMHSARNYDFRKGTKLGKKDHIVAWEKPVKPSWMDQKAYDVYPNKIKIRELEVMQKTPGFKSKKRVLVTTFLDPKNVSKNDLNDLYGYRWSVEIDLRAIKDTMNMGVVGGKTPEMVYKEIWARLLAYNLIREIMLKAAIAHKKNPRELSFKLALQVIDSFSQRGLLSNIDEKIYLDLLKIIAYKKVGNRAGRSEPRRVKRRPKPTPRLQIPRQQYHRQKAA